MENPFIKSLIENNEKRKDVFTIKATCHPPGEKNENYNGYLLKDDEIDKRCKEAIGLPSLYDHSDPLGKVVGSYKDPKDGSMVTVLEIDKNTKTGRETIEKINRGEIKGLSMGITHKLDTQSLNVVGRKINEISVTERPDLDTKIISIQDDSEKERELRNKVVEKFKSINDSYKIRETKANHQCKAL